jgi:hypothetical protein
VPTPFDPFQIIYHFIASFPNPLCPSNVTPRHGDWAKSSIKKIRIEWVRWRASRGPEPIKQVTGTRWRLKGHKPQLGHGRKIEISSFQVSRSEQGRSSRLFMQ